MIHTDKTVFLRRVLLADALTSALMGLLLALAAGPLEGLLGLPASLLRWAGIGLMPFAALVALLATRSTIPRWGVWAVVGINAVWIVDSFGLLLSGWFAPNLLGQAFVITQAIVVAVFAELQFSTLRRPRAMAA